MKGFSKTHKNWYKLIGNPTRAYTSGNNSYHSDKGLKGIVTKTFECVSRFAAKML